MATYPEWTGDPNLEPVEPENAYRVDPDTGEFVLVYPYLNKDGHEINDPTPMEPPLGYFEQPSIAEQIRQMIRSERLKQEAEEAGF